MPNCFSLTPKTQDRPALLHAVDAAICRFFEIDVDPNYYAADWYTVIGTLIAVKGCTLGTDALRREVMLWYHDGLYETLSESERRDQCTAMLAILSYLETFYRSDNWVQIGRA